MLVVWIIIRIAAKELITTSTTGEKTDTESRTEEETTEEAKD